jgi:hypothetical protein
MPKVTININPMLPVNMVKGALKLVFWPLKQVNNVLLDATDTALMARRIERFEQLEIQAAREMAEAVTAQETEEKPLVTTNVAVRRARKPKTATVEA